MNSEVIMVDIVMQFIGVIGVPEDVPIFINDWATDIYFLIQDVAKWLIALFIIRFIFQLISQPYRLTSRRW